MHVLDPGTARMVLENRLVKGVQFSRYRLPTKPTFLTHLPFVGAIRILKQDCIAPQLRTPRHRVLPRGRIQGMFCLGTLLWPQSRILPIITISITNTICLHYTKSWLLFTDTAAGSGEPKRAQQQL